MRDHEPEIFQRAAHLLLPKNYIRFRLTGGIATEVSDASGTLLLNVKNRRWSGEACSILGVDTALLPKVYESVEVTGGISLQVAEGM